MSAPMRIGVLTTSFPRTPGDTAGRFVLGGAQALAARGHQVEVLAPEPGRATPPPAFPGVHTRWVPYLRPRVLQRTFYGAGVPDNLRADPGAWAGLGTFPLAQLHRAWRAQRTWDALISHWALPSALCAGAVRQGRPHLAVLHSADLYLLSRLPGRRALAAQVAATATALCFVSERGRDGFLALLPPSRRASVAARCLVQPMGVDPVAAVPRPDRAPGPGARFRLVSVGRLVPIKGLVEAASALSHRADLEWTVAGDGPLAGELAALGARAKVRLSLPGSVTGPRKRRLLAAADVFLLPSRELAGGRSEGAPHALLEAMAAGLPAVAAAVGGVPELIRDGHNGLLFDPARPAELERAVDRLKRDEALRRRLGSAARRAAEPHLWPAVARRFEAALMPLPPPTSHAARPPLSALTTDGTCPRTV